MNPRRNYYRDLLCRPSDPPEKFKSNYRKIAKATHADSNGGSDEFRDLFQAATEAWSVLGDPILRASYVSARSAWLREVGGLQCSECGEALRFAVGQRKQRCPSCKTELQTAESDRVADSFFRPLEESGRRIGETVLDASQQEAERLGREFVKQSAKILSKLIVHGFDVARRKIGRTEE
jgi:curved DNA-binding protein CbpA